MNLQQLYYFRTVAELEHFTKAADQLMITQPSLSHSIRDLEAELGVHLFKRQGRNVKLTKYGVLFLEYVSEALDILEEGRRKLNDFINPDTGTVSLAYFSSLEEFIPYMVAKYYSSGKELAKALFQFQQLPNNSIEDGLLAGTTDLAFVTGLENEKLECHKIGVHDLVLLVSIDHPLAQQDSVDLRVLKNEPFIVYDHQCRIRSYIDEILAIADVTPHIVSETTHDTIIYSYVAANHGLGLVPEPLGVRRYNVKTLRIENQVPPREVFLTWKSMRYVSPAVKKFRDYIIESGFCLDGYRQSLKDGVK